MTSRPWQKPGANVSPAVLFAAVLFAAVLSAAVLGVLMGCARDSGLVVPANRLIEEDPQELLDLADFAQQVEVLRWNFADEAELEHWQIEGLEPDWQLEERGMTFRTDSSGAARLTRQVDFDASELDRLEIGLSGLRASRVRLLWAMQNQVIRGDRSISLRAREGKGQGRERFFRFQLDHDARWQGPIGHLAFEPTAAPGQVIRLRELVGWRFELDGEGLAELLSEPRKVDRAGQVRNAWLAVPETPLTHVLTVPKRGRLRFAFSLPTGWSSRVLYGVTVVAGGVETEVLAQAANAVDSGTWLDHEVDLDPWAGQQVELRFHTSLTRHTDPRHGLPAWAHPEIFVATQPGARAATQPNVVVISIDTLRADHMSLYGYSRPTTPNIDRWAQQHGVTFENHVAAAPWTLPSHLSMLTGLGPLTHGVNHNRSAPNDLELLAETFRDAGYATVAVTGGGFLHPRFGVAQGFDSYRHGFPGLEPEDRLEVNLEETLQWLTRLSARRPFFLFFHTYEVHDPYRARQPYFRQFGGPEGMEDMAVTADKTDAGWTARRHSELDDTLVEQSLNLVTDEELVRTLYDSGLAYTDAAIGRLLDHLDELGLRKSTVVVLTSDHGESLGEHGYAGHGNLYDDNLMVPLVIAAPGIDRAVERVEQQVRQVDLAPTLLELAGLPPVPGDGQSLLPLLTGDASAPPHPSRALSYNGLNSIGLAMRLGGRLKYIFSDVPWESEGREELYRLNSDRGEIENLASTEDGVENLRSEASELLESTYRGLAVVLRNDGAEGLKGLLSGPAVSLLSVKTTALSDAVRWQEGRLRFEIEPGQGLTLWLTRADGPIRLRGFLQAEGRRRGQFEIETSASELAEQSIWLALKGRQVKTLVAEEVPPSQGLGLSWRGPVEDLGPDPAEVDPELRARLEALGYL